MLTEKEPIVEVLNWLMAYEHFFGDMGSNEVKKQRLALRQLLEDAMGWWKTVTIEAPKEKTLHNIPHLEAQN